MGGVQACLFPVWEDFGFRISDLGSQISGCHLMLFGTARLPAADRVRRGGRTAAASKPEEPDRQAVRPRHDQPALHEAGPRGRPQQDYQDYAHAQKGCCQGAPVRCYPVLLGVTQRCAALLGRCGIPCSHRTHTRTTNAVRVGQRRAVVCYLGFVFWGVLGAVRRSSP